MSVGEIEKETGKVEDMEAARKEERGNNVGKGIQGK